tara:strand:- start:888 stop:1355 length:468 start_codon:yes stop_codon:yes gene_type:complete
MVRIVFKLFQKVQKLFLWLWQQDGTPSQLARGIALGVFSGCFPFFGLQTILGLMLASLFRGNHLLAAVGTWISNPVTYLPLYWLNYKVGNYFLGGSNNFQDFKNFTKDQLWDQGLFFSIRLLLGSTIMGILLGFISGLIVYFLVKIGSEKRNYFN